MEQLKGSNKQYFWAKIIFWLLLAILTLVLYLDRQEVSTLVFNAHWERLFWAVVFSFISLFSASYGFYVIGRQIELKVKPIRLFLAGFVTIVINDLIASASTAAFTLRVVLLRKKDVSAREIISASIFHSYFNLLVAILFLPFSLFYLSMSDDFPFSDKIVLVIFGTAMAMVFAASTWIFFSRKTRTSLIDFFERLICRFNNKSCKRVFTRFKETMDFGALVLNKKSTIAIVSVATLFDWLFTLFALWVCFWALGINLSFGSALSGFFVGYVIGFISLIPGGIGIQEGSMAGIYYLLGVPFSQAIIAVLLFRLIYYIIPFIPAVALYGNLLRNIKTPEQEAAVAANHD
jgi:glycosyltransferase 2 family protein